ncbi:glycosyltransferase [Thermomonas sp. XSG]|uniref:glycosyltransferase n=1 Tax=Thermomonas sp. XSG TaxID=2771436 RepID=UPI0016814BDE|nr:glycosyltransferase [Thermomonas sp. XSG]QNU15387.1 glycosyltransferase [Thermomonas sp. XSG]
MMQAKSQALLVLGMHRSGTSALTGLLGLHGVELGSNLSGAAADNQAGFWESHRVVDLHERLFAALGTSWDDPRELPVGWLETATRQGFVDDLVGLLRGEFGAAALWGVKDPRLCRVLPLWRQALARMSVEPKLVFALRDPGEVAGSLMRRNGLSSATSALLWLRHLVEPVQAAEGLRYCAIDYHALLQDWRGCMARAAAALGLIWPVSSDACAGAVSAYLRADLRHQRAADTRALLPGEWREWLLEAHADALAVADGVLDRPAWEASLLRTMARLAPAQPLIPDLQPASLIDASRRMLAEAEHARDDYRGEAARLFEESARAQRLVVETEARWQAAQQDLLAAWEKEKEIRAAAEQQAQAHALAEREALAAWEKEKEVRAAAEQQAQAAWEAEKRARAEADAQLSSARQGLLEAHGELLKRNARIERIQSELEAIKGSRSWRWTRPLRFVLRTLRHRGLTPEDRRLLGWGPHSQERAGASPALEAVTAASVSAVAVPAALAPRPSQRDVFVWAVIDWHFRIQRPQHLARELAAAGHRVFYVSNNFIDAAQPGFSVEALDADGRLFQVNLHLAGRPAIYHAAPDAAQREQLRASVGMLLAWTRSHACASLVQHPFWLETAQVLPNQRLVYDCMDHHAGFADNTDDVLAREHELMRAADLLVVTSDWLHEETRRHNPNCLTIRNASQYEHFCEPPAEVFRDPHGRRVIGYYGAIAEWFDVELVEQVARRHPDCLVLLVGADTAGAQRRLGHLDNVQFTGEVPYARLPFYLHAFDVCLLPFHVVPLTLATNPVKIYEYLSAGREVVSVALPEMRQFGDLVRTGGDGPAFLAALDAALQAPGDAAMVARRRAFAAGQTWRHRATDLMEAVEALPQPRVSVVVLCYNNASFTRACLDSLEKYSDYPNLELIAVDNASSDETPALLSAWAAAAPGRRHIANGSNLGFAGGNNVGLAAATGEYLVILNNDTFVTPGWVSTLVRHFRSDPSLGVLGPVTNNIGNEARIEIGYTDMAQMLDASGDYTARHAGLRLPLQTAAFFCVMLPRRVYEAVGGLDEAFGIGMFEDDDYCRRVEQAGWTVACAEDVFVHHHLSASFDQIKQERRQQMFEQNKAIYEAKWGPWVPHRYREQDAGKLAG